MHKNNIIHNLEHVISSNETVLNREKKKKKEEDWDVLWISDEQLT